MTIRLGKYSLGAAVAFLSVSLIGKDKKLSKVSDDPWKLLALASSKRPKTRLAGLRALSSKKFPDWLATQLVQACDERTLVALCQLGSRLPDLFYVSTPMIEYRFVHGAIWLLLHELLQNNPSDCARFHTDVALNRNRNNVPITTEEEEIVWGRTEDLVDISEFYHSRPDLKRLVACMEALNAHSKITDQSCLMVKRGVLSILKSIWTEFEDSGNPTEIQLKHLSLRILSNIALAGTDEAHAVICGGWLKVLGTFLKQTAKLDHQLLALKVLSNLDYTLADKSQEKYEEGVYLVHPNHYKLGNEPKVDLVFVHGLRGGIFKTWRQKDLPVQKKKKKKKTEKYLEELYFVPRNQMLQQEQRTQCWPRDWLPADMLVPCRILGVDYTSYLSDWKRKCPEESRSRSIEDKSEVLRSKLISAGLGRRPIVWVCHSMGGLIVKKLLTEIREAAVEDAEGDYY